MSSPVQQDEETKQAAPLRNPRIPRLVLLLIVATTTAGLHPGPRLVQLRQFLDDEKTYVFENHAPC